MVSYEVQKPPQGFFSRMKDGMRLAAAFVKNVYNMLKTNTIT